jgi:hypothetical protein
MRFKKLAIAIPLIQYKVVPPQNYITFFYCLTPLRVIGDFGGLILIYTKNVIQFIRGLGAVQLRQKL